MHSISSSIVTYKLHFLAVNSKWMCISAVGLYFMWGWEGLRRNTCEIFRMDLHRRQRKPDSDKLTYTVFLLINSAFVGFQKYMANKREQQKPVLIGFLISQPFCWLTNLSANHTANNCTCKKIKGLFEPTHSWNS